MDEQLLPNLEERVAHLEAEVRTLNDSLARLTAHVEVGSGVARGVTAPAQTGTTLLSAARLQQPAVPLHEIYCPSCRGGNPPGGTYCMWCHQPMSLKARSRVSIPPPPAASPAPAPAPTRDSRARMGDSAPYTPGALQVAKQDRAGSTAGAARKPLQQPVRQVAAPPVPRKPFNITVWLSRIGILLFLLGVAFLFKYSYDQGWIDAFFNYQMRVVTGITLGSLLLFFGLRISKDHSNLSQVLLGGSIATYYITAYAASMLFSLASIDTSSAFMLSITALAFVLATRQNYMSLAIIGVTGGLLTPFVLYSLHIDPAWLVAYICYILAGSSAIFLFKGWRTLFWVSFLGGWGSLAIAEASTLFTRYRSQAEMSGPMQIGVVVCALAFWGVPVLREVLFTINPKRWARQPLPAFLARSPLGRSLDGAGAAQLDIFTACFLTVLMPISSLYVSVYLWDGMTKEAWGVVVLAVAAIFGAIGWLLRRFNIRIAYTHVATAVLLLTIFLGLELVGDILLVALAVEGTALHLIARRYEDNGARLGGHALFAGAAMWLGARLLTGVSYDFGTGVYPVFNARALTDLAVMALALLVSTWHRLPEEKLLYRGAAYVALLPWLAQQMRGVEGYYLMLAWAVYGLALHYLAQRREDASASVVGHLSFGITGVFLAITLAYNFASGWRNLPFVSLAALATLGVILLAAASSFIVRPERAIQVYRIGIHVAVVGWLTVQAQAFDWPAHYTLFYCMAYGTALMLVGRRVPDRLTYLSGQVIATAVGGMLLAQTVLGLAMTNSYQTPIFNWRGLSDLGVLALGLVVWRLLVKEKYALAYGLGLHIGFAGWLWQELGMIPPSTVGNAVASVAWGVLAVGLVAAGIRKDRDRTLIYMGVGTLFATSLKLLLVDLQYVDAIWRILLFLGFGALFLGIAYYLEKIMLPPPVSPDSHQDHDTVQDDEEEQAAVESGDMLQRSRPRARVVR